MILARSVVSGAEPASIRYSSGSPLAGGVQLHAHSIRDDSRDYAGAVGQHSRPIMRPSPSRCHGTVAVAGGASLRRRSDNGLSLTSYPRSSRLSAGLLLVARWPAHRRKPPTGQRRHPRLRRCWSQLPGGQCDRSATRVAARRSSDSVSMPREAGGPLTEATVDGDRLTGGDSERGARMVGDWSNGPLPVS